MTDTADTNNPVAPFTESAALAEILQWSVKRPLWLRDALRRLMQTDDLSSDDLDTLEEICLGAEDKASPLSEGDIAPQRLPGKPVAICGLREPVGVNALAMGQGLKFAAAGLTIVYGDNGSGKSGYVRILKHACRSRDEKFSILRNVNDGESVPQSAVIDYAVDGNDDHFQWSPDGDDHPDLPAVSIFDSRSANTHVRETNNVAYVPFPMELLDRLGKVCDTLKARVADRISALQSQTPIALKTPTLSSDTAAGAFLHGLWAKSKPDTLDLLIALTDEETSRFAALDADLAQNPAKAAAKIIARAGRLSAAMSRLSALIDATTSEAFADLQRLKDEATATAEAERLASEQLFQDVPLSGVGSQTWRTLWEAARSFSNTEAYPDRSFPEPLEDERCVLCHQAFDVDAKVRMASFETHVQGAARQAAKTAADAIKQKRIDIEDTAMSLSDIRGFAALLKTELDQPALADSIRRCALTAAWRHRALLRGHKEPGSAVALPEDTVDALRKDLTARAAALSGEKDSDARLKLVAEHAGLKDRIALAGLEEDVRAEIARKVKIDKLKAAEKTCGTGVKRAITTKNKELSEKLVTDLLRGRFAREVSKLQIGTMPIELRKVRDRDAQSFFKVALVDKPDEPIGEVLSEGEHRCVALAAFLAELVTSRDYSAIVFDDPMSSLDHKYRRRVAGRLAEEADHRQVVVFTHDLTFLFDIQREAEALDQNVHFQNVHRVSSEPGHVSQDLPIDAKAAIHMAAALRSELKSVRDHFDGWPEARRSVFAQGFLGKLRNGWEQGIADMLRPVMSRFNYEIKPSSLYRIAIINDTDVLTVRRAQARLSEDQHTSPETINPSETTHAELLGELKNLEDWLQDVEARRKAAVAPKVTYSM